MSVPPFYAIEVITPSGESIDTIDNPISLVAARSYSSVGSAVLTLLPNYDEEFFRYNMRFKLWRTDSKYGKSLFGDTIWFLRKFINNIGQRHFEIELADALTLLSNPVVAYTAQTPYADKTLEELGDITYSDYYRIDNLMKAYVRENLGASALDATRINPYIVVEQNRNLAPHGEKSASWAKLSSVLSDLARMSAEKGMELFYDLIPQSNNTFLFKVWRDIRGIDRGFSSSESIIFSDENGDLDDVQVTYDYSAMATYCYVLGYDTGPSQVIVEVGNSAIIESDPFGRIEFTANSTDNDVSSVLLADGQAALYGLRPRRVLSAKLSPASSLHYGTDFAYGDRIGVEVGGRRYDCQISAVRAEWKEARELLDIRLDGSESLWNPTYWEGEDRTPAPIVVPGITYEVPEPESDVYVPPSYGDPDLFTGDAQAYVMWNTSNIFRTWNLLATSPLWHTINAGVTGVIYDCQYVNHAEGVIGAWLFTSEAIWWTPDIMASDVIWTAKLTLATINTGQVTPPTTMVNRIETMFHYWLAPGHLCVAVGLAGGSGADSWNYQHAYFWVTEDYGATWTTVDMTEFLANYGPDEYVRGYFGSSLYAMAASRNTPTIWCARSAPVIGLQGLKYVFYSNDMGYTWQKGVALEYGGNNSQDFAILNPFPNNTDPSYSASGAVGVSSRLQYLKSTDAWLTSVHVGDDDGTDPTGYWGSPSILRVNKRTFDNDHVIAWHYRAAASPDVYDLLQSEDRGVTWSVLYADSPSGNISITPQGTKTGPSHNTPNGWPSDIDQWILIRLRATTAEFPTIPIVQLTLDNFSTLLDKTGDLRTVVSSWPSGIADGFALPKIAPNVLPAPTEDSRIRVRVARSTASVAAPTITISSTGVVEGDRVLLHLRTTTDFAPTSIPSGFTLVPNSEQTGATSLRVYEKIATGSEPATYDFGFATGNCRLGLLALYGLDGGTVTLDASASVNQTSGSSGTPVCPSVDTTTPYTFLAVFWSLSNSGANPTAQAGMVKQYSASGNGVHCTTQETYSGVGATGTRYITSGSSFPVKSCMTAWKVVA